MTTRQLSNDGDNRDSEILTLEEGAKRLGIKARKVRRWCRAGIRIGFVRRGTVELMILYRDVPLGPPPVPKPRKLTGNMTARGALEAWKPSASFVHYPPALIGRR